MNALDRRFGVTAHGSSVRTEVVAGAATFCTLSYILFVQPAMLATTGMPASGVLFATCVASALACFLMALLANYPIALAPAMGHNAFFAFTVCGALGFMWQQALAANLIAGVVFVAISATRLREAVMVAIPDSIQRAIAGGIGLLLAVLGLQWGGLVVAHPATLVQLGGLGDPVARLTLCGLALTAVLLVLRVPGAILLGIGGTALLGWAAGAWLGSDEPLVAVQHGIAGAPPAPSAAFQHDFAGLFARPASDVVSVVLTFLLLAFFDTAGTLVGVAQRAGLLEKGRLPRAKQAFVADSTGTVLGAVLGTSTVTSYVESAAGVAVGGRTGLAAVVAGVLLLLSLFFTPLVEAIGAGVLIGEGPEAVRLYPVLAPVLILIGVLMIGALRDVDWEEPGDAIPAFLTLLVIPMAMSITDGIAFGMIAYSLLALVARRRAPLLVHGLALVFVARYVWLR